MLVIGTTLLCVSIDIIGYPGDFIVLKGYIKMNVVLIADMR